MAATNIAQLSASHAINCDRILENHPYGCHEIIRFTEFGGLLGAENYF